MCGDRQSCVSHKDAQRNSVVRCSWPFVICLLNGEVHPKMKVSYLVEFGTLSRMVKVRGACDEPFWVISDLINCAAHTR